MALEFGKTTFKELTSNLELVEKWLCANGINIKGSRFEAVKKNAIEIANYQEQGKTSEIIAQLGNKTVIASLIEAAPFNDIYMAFKSLKSHEIPRSRLKSIIAGTFLIEDEDATTNQARNSLFELELAVLIKSKGIGILNFNDISFNLENAIFNIQCKRPMSTKSLDANVQEAISQAFAFFKKVDVGIDCRGIIAVSIDKILGFDKDKIINTPNSVSLENYIKMRSKALVDQMGYVWNKIKDPRILAVFVFFKGVAQVQETNLLSVVKFTTVVELADNMIDYSRLRILEGKLLSQSQF